ncbi:MAG: septum formation protein Maf [Verrucomicrobia bacterium GWF2_51_19]|nr:MAG: septum formation protein Maf [Verrucomicrobia bacterium GWF2_51_19]
MNVELILASGSAGRWELLEQAGIPAKVVVSGVAEWESSDDCPKEQCLHNARIKADAVSKQYPEALVLAADTIVALGNTVYHKPVDMDHAWRMFGSLVGTTHSVWTGVALKCIDKGIDISFCEESKVTLKQMKHEDIAELFAKVNPLDKSGSYAIQKDDWFIEKIEGSYSNIVGLPLETLAKIFDTLRPF